MLSYKEFLFERRSNHENNPKISTYDYLKKYKDDPDVYISMTRIDKIGINPQSKFNTPLGVYCYPLREMWNLIETGKTTSDLPFAGDRPYVWILRSKNKNFINDMYKDYGSDNFDKDVKTLKKIWNRDNKYIIDLRNKELEKRRDYNTKKLYFYDEGSRDYNNFLIILKDIENEIKKNNSDYLWDEIYEDGLKSAREKNSISSFWNVTRLVSLHLTKDKEAISSITKWNSILRECGYSGFADKSGKGYIHPSESTQAVFLTRDAFEVIDKIPNRDHKENSASAVITDLLNQGTAKAFKSVYSIIKNIKDKELLENVLSYLLYRIVRYKSYNGDKELYNHVYYIIKYISENIDKSNIKFQKEENEKKLFNIRSFDPDDKILKLLNNYKD